MLSLLLALTRTICITSFMQQRYVVRTLIKNTLIQQRLPVKGQERLVSSIGLYSSPFDINSITSSHTVVQDLSNNVFLSMNTNNNDQLVATAEPSRMLLSNTLNDLSNQNLQDIAVFIIGVIPFIWATIEFFRRVSLGLPFGTGNDSVTILIGEDDNLEKSRGKQVLGKGALVIFILLIGIAVSSIGIAIYSVITSPPPPNM